MIGENTISSVAERNFLLSRAKAKQRLKREGYPSPDQIIQRAKAKVDWPDERWDEIRRIANATDKPDMLVVSHKTDFAHRYSIPRLEQRYGAILYGRQI